MLKQIWVWANMVDIGLGEPEFGAWTHMPWLHSQIEPLNLRRSWLQHLDQHKSCHCFVPKTVKSDMLLLLFVLNDHFHRANQLRPFSVCIHSFVSVPLPFHSWWVHRPGESQVSILKWSILNAYASVILHAKSSNSCSKVGELQFQESCGLINPIIQEK